MRFSSIGIYDVVFHMTQDIYKKRTRSYAYNAFYIIQLKPHSMGFYNFIASD